MVGGRRLALSGPCLCVRAHKPLPCPACPACLPYERVVNVGVTHILVPFLMAADLTATKPGRLEISCRGLPPIVSPRNLVRLVALISESMLRRRGVTGRAGSPISPALTRFQLAALGWQVWGPRQQAASLPHIFRLGTPGARGKGLIAAPLITPVWRMIGGS